MATRDVGERSVVSPAEMVAELVLLDDAGYADIEPVDADARQFDVQVRAANPHWTPGAIPKLPHGYQDGTALRVTRIAACGAQAIRRTGSTRQPRSRRLVRRARARSPSRSEPPEPEPPLSARHRRRVNALEVGA